MASHSITVRYFASLREALARGRALRCALNQQMADEATPVPPGAEVAFFPPVTGG